MLLHPGRLAFVLACITAVAALPAQCTTQWQVGLGPPGVEGFLTPMVTRLAGWDPDGAGPLPARVAVFGQFHSADGVWSPGLATVDPQGGYWSGFPAAFPEAPTAMTVDASGALIVGGSTGVRRWTGTAWQSLASGPGGVLLLHGRANGDLVAAGDWPGGCMVLSGGAWQALGAGLPGWPANLPWYPARNAAITAFVDMPNGDLVAIGNMPGYVHRWNGTTWATTSWPLLSPVPRCAALDANGNLIVGGEFAGLLRWNGSTWTSISMANECFLCLHRTANGDVLAGSAPTQQGLSGTLRRWNGFSFATVSTVATGSFQSVLELANGTLIAGGTFLELDGRKVRRVARRTGTLWEPLGRGIERPPQRLAAVPTGGLVATGLFTHAGQALCNGAARWSSPAGWEPLGTGVTGTPWCALPITNGVVYVGGNLSAAGGSPINNIARWDGTAWSPLGLGTDGEVTAMALLPDGRLLVGGAFSQAGGVAAVNLACWTGSAWTTFGSGAPLGAGPLQVVDLAVHPGGDAVVVTQNPWTGMSWIHRGDGTVWMQLGVTSGYPRSVVCTPAGDIVVGGHYLSLTSNPWHSIASWNGNGWSSVGGLTDSLWQVAVQPDGDLYVCTYSPSPPKLKRWDGTTWAAVAGAPAVTTLATLWNGDVAVAGDFTTAGGLPSGYFAILRPSCPATAASTTTGCTGSAGPLTLAAAVLPWVGASYHGRASGFAAGALVVSVLGLNAANVPLATVVPGSPANCSLLVAPDVVAFVPGVAGVATTTLAIPDTAALVGVAFRHQFGQLEFAGALPIASGSNALQLTIGSL